MIELDIVVLSKDRPDLLKNLATDMAKQEGVTGQLVVVDNGSDAETVDIVQDQEEHPFKWIWIHEDIAGFANGVNKGAAIANKSSILVLLNNDVRLPNPNTLYNMAMHMESDKIGIAGVRLLNSGGQMNHDGTSFDWGRPFHMGNGVHPSKVDAVCSTTPATTFACAALRRSLFDQLDGLNEMYSWGSEDVDFCMSAAELGYWTVTCRESPAIHNEFGTRPRGGDVAEMRMFHGKWSVTGRGMLAMQKLGWGLQDSCGLNG